MRYKLKVYNIWEYGQRVDSEGKPHQEDSIFPAYEQQKDSDRLFILCDGMGGHEAGEVASSTVCKAMSNSIFDSTPDVEGDFSDDNLRKAIDDAFNALDSLPLGDVSAEKKMGTTMTFLKFHSKGCTIAHMGDSRVYHIRSGKGRDDTKILFKTNDHSLVNDLIKVGELTPEEAKHSKQKNIITRAMQPKMERHPKPDIYHTTDIKPGDYFYMCSDGMLEQMEDENLLFNFSEATGDDENKINILTQATSQNLDNHSAIIIHILDVIDPLPVDVAPVPPTANKPAPIMAEVDEDSQEEEAILEGKDDEEETKAEDTTVEESIETEILKSKEESIIRFDRSNNSDKRKEAQSKKTKLIKYVSMILIIVLLALGVFLVCSMFSKNPNEKPEKIENPQKPNKKPEGKHHGSTSDQTLSSQQSPDKPNEATEPSRPNSNSQLNGSMGSVNPSVPNKLHNALSSQATPSEANSNGGTNGHTHSSGGNNHNGNFTTNNLNQATQHGGEVISSDQQAVLDLSNGKKNKKEWLNH